MIFVHKWLGHMEQITCTSVLVRLLPTGKTQILLQKLGLCALQVRETTICRKNGRQCHLNDIMQVIIDRECWQVYFECFCYVFWICRWGCLNFLILLRSWCKCFLFFIMDDMVCYISRNIKTLLYKTLIRSVLTYGAETCVLSKQDEHRLSIFER